MWSGRFLFRQFVYWHSVELVFIGQIIEWRGPAPFLFVPAPPEIASQIKEMAAQLTYGWGCIPVRARIGSTEFKTSLFPRNGTYMVPVKVIVQRAESVGEGDQVEVSIRLTD